MLFLSGPKFSLIFSPLLRCVPPFPPLAPLSQFIPFPTCHEYFYYRSRQVCSLQSLERPLFFFGLPPPKVRISLAVSFTPGRSLLSFSPRLLMKFLSRSFQQMISFSVLRVWLAKKQFPLWVFSDFTPPAFPSLLDLNWKTPRLPLRS